MIDYYEQNAEQYFASTVTIDPSSFLLPLIDRLPPGSRILDVGCGSGRDLLWLKQKGFEAVGLERSPGLARLAREYAGCRILEEDFNEFDFAADRFDALLLVGSLVHLTRTQLTALLLRLKRGLNDGGLIYLTLKEGQGIQRGEDGREFVLWRQQELELIFTAAGLQSIYSARQESKLRISDTWLSYLLCPEKTSL